MTRRYEFTDGTFPIQIRPDLVVRLYPIPHDLTHAEASKIARVVLAMACDTDGSPEGPDPKGLDGEAATAGAAESGIAPNPPPSPKPSS